MSRDVLFAAKCANVATFPAFATNRNILPHFGHRTLRRKVTHFPCRRIPCDRKKTQRVAKWRLNMVTTPEPDQDFKNTNLEREKEAVELSADDAVILAGPEPPVNSHWLFATESNRDAYPNRKPSSFQPTTTSS